MMKEKIREYLRGVRMMSIANLADRLDKPTPELIPLLETLETEGSVRFGGGGCQSSCLSCASDCESAAAPSKNEHTIIISMLMRRRDEE